ncbi:MAG: NTP transferase domain-containing protein, partial [Candidatus Puniceispirillaceae bacterium]
MEFTVIILAAGKGTRMRSERAKPLHEIAGKALISWVMDAATQAGCTDILVVTSPEQDELQHAISDKATLYIQKQQNGTADAVRAAQSHLDRLPADRPVIILYADTPLITPDTIAMLISQITAGTDLCVSGFETEPPTGYGRLKTDASGRLVAIIEESDANQDEKTITHVNGGIMAGKAGLFQTILPTIGADNAQQEYYLTD